MRGIFHSFWMATGRPERNVPTEAKGDFEIQRRIGEFELSRWEGEGGATLPQRGSGSRPGPRLVELKARV